VLVDLERWFGKLPYIREDNYTFVTCGDWDLSNCLKNEARQKKLGVRPFLRAYINIKKYFDAVMKSEKRVSGMMEMLQVLGIKHEGKHHSGIDDVLNICNICIELVRKHGATFPVKEVNRVKYYVPADPDIEYLLVLDFEATCIKDSKIQPCPEII
jgi:inhibitor of KinA sporulation pathway (predicted exonuclease)